MILRALAMIVLVIGAGASLGIMVVVGHAQPSHLLMLLFGGWVLSPFAALIFVNVISKRWSNPVRESFYIAMLIVAFGSVAIYLRVASTRPAQPAFWFLIAPLLSWLLIAMLVGFAETRRRGERSKSPC